MGPGFDGGTPLNKEGVLRTNCCKRIIIGWGEEEEAIFSHPLEVLA